MPTSRIIWLHNQVMLNNRQQSDIAILPPVASADIWNYYYNYYYCFMALWILFGTTWVSRYQRKHSPTHTFHGHQSSLICLWSMASSLFNLCAWQSFCNVFAQSLSKFFFGMSLGLAPSTSYCIPFFTHIIVFFWQQMPIPSQRVVPRLSSKPMLSVNPLQLQQQPFCCHDIA